MLLLIDGLIILGAVIGSVLGAETVDELSNWLTFANLGVAGVGLFAFVKGWIIPGKVYDRAIQREERKEEEIQRMSRLLQEEMIPELTRSRELQERLMQVVEAGLDISRVLEEHKAALIDKVKDKS